MIDDKAGFCAGHLFYMFFLNVVDLCLLGAAVLGIISGKGRGFLKGAVRKFFIIAFDNEGTYMVMLNPI